MNNMNINNLSMIHNQLIINKDSNNNNKGKIGYINKNGIINSINKINSINNNINQVDNNLNNNPTLKKYQYS